KIRYAARRHEPDRMKPDRRVLRNLHVHAELGVVLAVVLIRWNSDPGWKTGLQRNRIGKVSAGESPLHARAALHAERQRDHNRGRLRIGLVGGRRLGGALRHRERQGEQRSDGKRVIPAGYVAYGHGTPREESKGWRSQSVGRRRRGASRGR